MIAESDVEDDISGHDMVMEVANNTGAEEIESEDVIAQDESAGLHVADGNGDNTEDYTGVEPDIDFGDDD
jgi:hypothetical protein